MQKVGFIDYYLDEWHANNYPPMLEKASDGNIKVCFAYGKISSPKTGMTSREWGEKYGIEIFDTIEEVVEKSDVLIVLAPDNPGKHPELCKIPLSSGKPTYVDKTFAKDKKTALEIFALADKHQTPCWSSSALRFAKEFADLDKSLIDTIYSEGPGTYEIYSIHQIEPIVSLMQCAPKRVIFTGNKKHPAMTIEFSDGRTASMLQMNGASFRFTAVDWQNNMTDKQINSDFFASFIKSLIIFFETATIPVPHEQTVDIIAIREAGLKAMKSPLKWVNIN